MVKTMQKRALSMAFIFQLILTQLCNIVLAATCEKADYKHIVGGANSDIQNMLVAPNSHQDLLIAGKYRETSDYEEFLYVYLF